ncbi:glutathione peroxidase GPX1 SKDI_11G1840 [Saccharomyces kudriavzevii IFO 1802]|uniref:Uncharacterized protein n=2 Tax=Saccharomyces kudriavzevii (strain ATCC MYA-4449 / AS 2.2408 / CBS 8840 / NBRC 1802 / NCYC 2889) TaxID=226230 RepID=A0AA35J3D5_SACK1|nr:uncharacterized protein SKDI_11G1840 [Saccharomyces kudriavzevii IFO 1802]EJT44435.1 GPX1-like protein [Saccharomyces kudriavzevii IFO 1802]CAI4044933.1 hypothetical protein SKDI_11G1840 [Saccharomyces kudriavzevii IFO 1802]
MSEFYSFAPTDQDGNPFPLSSLHDKVVLVVNVASHCTFTPQYKELEYLYEKYRSYGLEIIAFPCGQFGNQEFEKDEEINKFCQNKFGVTFPILHKIQCNGQRQDPVYRFLKNSVNGKSGIKMIKWNFEKFLIDRNGKVVKRFSCMTRPLELSSLIEGLLSEPQKQET